MSKWQLAVALFARGNMTTDIITKPGATSIRGVVQRVERESGDGRSFNVTYSDSQGIKKTVFVRTID